MSNVIRLGSIRSNIGEALLAYPFTHIENEVGLMRHVHLVRFIHLNTGQDIRVTYNVTGASVNVDLITPSTTGSAVGPRSTELGIIEGVRFVTFIKHWANDSVLIKEVRLFVKQEVLGE